MPWDPSIILSGKQPAGADPNETLRTLSQLSLQGLQKQQGEASLASLLQEQGQKRALEGIYRANAGNRAALPGALMGGGFAKQAYDEEDQQAQGAKATQDRMGKQIELSARALHSAKDNASLAAAKQQMRQAGIDEQHVAQIPDNYEQAKPQIDAFVSWAIPVEKQAELAQKDRHDTTMAGMRVTDTGTGQRMGFNPETGEYDRAIGGAKPLKAAGDGGGGGANGGLSPAALESAASRYYETGEMVPSGQGKGGLAIRTAVLNRAAELGQDSIGGNKADYHANSASLKKLQTTADNMQSFEDTALKNLDTALAAAHKIPDYGGALLNKPIRAWSSMLGNTDMSAYKAGLTTARTEISKVLSGSTGGGGVSDSARHEVEALMGDDATPAQLEAAAKILRTDMANRKTAVEESMARIRGRMSGKKSGGDKGGASGGAAPLTAEEKAELEALRKEHGK